MNASTAFWLNFRRIDTGVRVNGEKRSLLQILIDGKDAQLTDELQDFLKNAAGDMLYLIRAYRKLRTQLAEERREAKIILRELRDEIEQLKR
jgi:ribonuclease D